MRVYGYNRVSTKQQHLDRGEQTIRDFCKVHGLELEAVLADKGSGKDFERVKYLILRDELIKAGDVIIIPEYDRLGRAEETKRELEYFKDKGVKVVFADIPMSYEYNFVETENEEMKFMRDFAYSMLIQLYDLMAQQELKRKKKRQREGIEQMKARGEWERYGRHRSMPLSEFAEHYKRVEAGEISNNGLARELNIPYQRYYRYKKELKGRENNS